MSSTKKQPINKCTCGHKKGDNKRDYKGPDERGHYPTVGMSINESTQANGFVVSGPQGNGTI